MGELELNLAAAAKQCSGVISAIEGEGHAHSAAQSETQALGSLEKRQTQYEEQLTRLRGASSLLGELLRQNQEGVFVDQIVTENASEIGAIFEAIHAPREFAVSAAQGGSLSIIRDSSKESVSLQQMSTGQRAAYALSLFLAMNRQLRTGPPVLLLDDPIAHVDDLNILSFLDHLREVAIAGRRQIFMATADDKLASLFRQKFKFLGAENFRDIVLSREDEPS